MINMFTMIENAFTKEECEYIIEKGNKETLIKAYVGDNTNGRIEEDNRRSKIAWLQPENDPDWSNLQSRLYSIFFKVNAANFGVDINYIQSMQFTKYEDQEQGHYDWHMDSFLNRKEYSYDRKLSLVLHLNDPKDYEGGEFQIENTTIEFKQGSILIFPSFLKHRVTPVTKGVRYSLVSWIEGPPWR